MHLVKRLGSRIVDQVWERELPKLPPLRRFLFRQIRFVDIIAMGLREKQLQLQALALSFKMLLALVPLLAVAFSMFKAFGVHYRLRPILDETLAPLGAEGQEITQRLVEFVDRMNVGAFGAVGLLVLLVTVVSLMASVENAFNQIWRVGRARRLSRRFSDYLSTLLIGPVLGFSATALSASLRSNRFIQALMDIEFFGNLIVLGLSFAPYLMIWGVFTFLYFFIPNTNVRLKSALVGGLVAGVLYEAAGRGFAAFVVSSTNYYAIYSSFAILILFLFWVYVCWYIVLLGAHVAYADQHVASYRRELSQHPKSPAAREKLALGIMTRIGENFLRGKPPATPEELAEELNISTWLLNELLDVLNEKGLVIEAGDDNRYVPAKDLERIGIGEIIDAVRTHGESNLSFNDGARGSQVSIEALMTDIARSMKATLSGKNLKDLILRNPAEGSAVKPPS